MLMKLKPATAKGTYMRSVTISTTHGPGIKIDTDAVHRARTLVAAIDLSRATDFDNDHPVEEAGGSRGSPKCPAETRGRHRSPLGWDSTPRLDQEGFVVSAGDTHG